MNASAGSTQAAVAAAAAGAGRLHVPSRALQRDVLALGGVQQGSGCPPRQTMQSPYLTSSSLVNVQLNGVDTAYAYDGGVPNSIGNVTGTTTYAGTGWVKWNGSAWSASTPGNGSTARTTTTTYHYLFRHLPTSVQYPIGPGGTPLTEPALYDV